MNEDIVYDKEKFKNVIHHIIYKYKHEEIGRTILYHLLYFTDFNFYELYEKSLTGMKYINERIIIPDQKKFDEAINELVKEGKIKEEKIILIKNYDYYTYQYTALMQPENTFNTKERNVIEENMLKLADMDSTTISMYSHGDKPWRISKDGEEINYEAVFYRGDEYQIREYDED